MLRLRQGHKAGIIIGARLSICRVPSSTRALWLKRRRNAVEKEKALDPALGQIEKQFGRARTQLEGQ